MEAKIRQALSESDSPMKALDIAKKVDYTKKEVNKTLYEMEKKGEVKIANETNPPTWRLVSGSASLQDSTGDQSSATATETQPEAAASSSSAALVESPKAAKTTDSELLTKILSVLSADRPLSAPDVARKVTADTSDVKRVLYEAERDGKVENTAPKGNKPSWRLKTATPPQAQFDGDLLYTLKTSGDGRLTFNPVAQDHIKQQAASITTTLTPRSTEPSVETTSEQSASIPPSSTSEQPASIPPSSTSEQPASIPPSSTSEQPASIPPSSTSEQPASIPPSSTSEQPPSIPPSSTSSTDTTSLEEPLAAMAISSRSSDVPSTKPNNLAAKFELSSKEKEEVNELLRSNTGENTSEEVMAGIGAGSRDLVMVYLEDLTRKGRVKKHHNTGPATYEWLGEKR